MWVQVAQSRTQPIRWAVVSTDPNCQTSRLQRSCECHVQPLMGCRYHIRFPALTLWPRLLDYAAPRLLDYAARRRGERHDDKWSPKQQKLSVMTTNGTLKSISWTYPCLSQTGVSSSLYFFGSISCGRATPGQVRTRSFWDLACLNFISPRGLVAEKGVQPLSATRPPGAMAR